MTIARVRIALAATLWLSIVAAEVLATAAIFGLSWWWFWLAVGVGMTAYALGVVVDMVDDYPREFARRRTR